MQDGKRFAGYVEVKGERAELEVMGERIPISVPTPRNPLTITLKDPKLVVKSEAPISLIVETSWSYLHKNVRSGSTEIYVPVSNPFIEEEFIVRVNNVHAFEGVVKPLAKLVLYEEDLGGAWIIMREGSLRGLPVSEVTYVLGIFAIPKITKVEKLNVTLKDVMTDAFGRRVFLFKNKAVLVDDERVELEGSWEEVKLVNELVLLKKGNKWDAFKWSGELVQRNVDPFKLVKEVGTRGISDFTTFYGYTFIIKDNTLSIPEADLSFEVDGDEIESVNWGTVVIRRGSRRTVYKLPSGEPVLVGEHPVALGFNFIVEARSDTLLFYDLQGNVVDYLDLDFKVKKVRVLGRHVVALGEGATTLELSSPPPSSAILIKRKWSASDTLKGLKKGWQTLLKERECGLFVLNELGPQALKACSEKKEVIKVLKLVKGLKALVEVSDLRR